MSIRYFFSHSFVGRYIQQYGVVSLFILALLIFCHILTRRILDVSTIDIIVNTLAIIFIVLLAAKIKYINMLVSFIIGIILSLEISFFFIYGEKVGPAVLSAAIDEIALASSVLPEFLVLFSFLVVFISIFIYLSMRNLSNLSSFKYFLLLFISLTSISVGFTSLVYDLYTNNRDKRGKSNFWAAPIDNIKNDVLFKYPLLIGDSFYIGAHFYELARIRGNASHDLVLPGVILDSKKHKPTKFILVLGETSLRTHYSLYGYPYKTTPRLDKLYKDNKIIKIDNVVSPASITRDSLRLSLSFDTPNNSYNFYNYKNIVELAETAGYQTIWLSSTIDFGSNGTFVGMVEKSANIYRDASNDLELKSQKDIVLIDKLEEFYKSNKKQFFIIHLTGSHLPYETKSDSEESYFVTTKEHTAYDRSILHTDKILSRLINVINKYDEDTILYYYSDHGEIVNLGHGKIFGGYVEQYEIPLIIYQHKNTFPIRDIIEKYRGDEGILNNFNSHFIVSELIGYSIDNKLLEQGKNESKYIYHADGKVYLYKDIINKNFRPK